MISIMGLTPQDAVEYVSNGTLTVEQFKFNCKAVDYRIGQGWMNFLNRKDYDLLTPTGWDPFYSNDWARVLAALCFVLDPKCDLLALRNEMYDAEGTE